MQRLINKLLERNLGVSKGHNFWKKLDLSLENSQEFKNALFDSYRSIRGGIEDYDVPINSGSLYTHDMRHRRHHTIYMNLEFNDIGPYNSWKFEDNYIVGIKMNSKRLYGVDLSMFPVVPGQTNEYPSVSIETFSGSERKSLGKTFLLGFRTLENMNYIKRKSNFGENLRSFF